MALNLFSSCTSRERDHLNMSTAAFIWLRWLRIWFLRSFSCMSLIIFSSRNLCLSFSISYFTPFTCWFFTRYMEKRAFWTDSLCPFYLSKFICYSSLNLWRLFSSFIILYTSQYFILSMSSTYLHELLIIFGLQVSHVLRSLTGLRDLLHGSLVLQLEQAHSVPQVEHVFLNSKVYSVKVGGWLTGPFVFWLVREGFRCLGSHCWSTNRCFHHRFRYCSL